MARISNDQRLSKIHVEAKHEFDSIQSSLRDERLQCLKDRRFYSVTGAQWEGPLGEQFDNKPKMEVNKIHLAVIRIFNEYRHNRISVDFVSKDGSENSKMADVCDGLYRADEQDSCAEEAYDNAFEEGVGGGFGAWRLRACYEDEESYDNERQRIRIEPIFDADSSVFFDLNSKRQDKSDAKTCFVISSMSYGEYKDTYEDDPASWPKDIHQYEFDWLTPDVVYIAEYYRVETKSELVRVFEGLDGGTVRHKESEFEEDESLEDTLNATGYKEVGSKRVKCSRVHKYIMNGARILEDCGIVAGKYIPIVPFYGKRWFVDNVERCMGHVRLAKDAQRLANMQRSKLAEISALSSVEKPIVLPEQIAGNSVMWEQDNIQNFPYLLLNPIKDAMGQTVPSGPVAYTRAPNIPPAMAALLQITEQDMQDLLGNQQNAEEMMSNVSGKAIELVQTKIDMQAYIYMSNMAKAIRRSGEIWLSMAKELYVEEGRKMKSVGQRGQLSSVELMKPGLSEGGSYEMENDLSRANFDVTVEVGPSSESKRQATVRSLTALLQATADPETQQILSAMILMNIEGEGLSDLNEFFRKKLLRMGAVKPTEEEAQELAEAAANAKPDPQEQYLQAAADQATAEAVKARADTVLTVAKAEETKAKTIQTLSQIDLDERQQALDTVQMLSQQQVSVPTPT